MTVVKFPDRPAPHHDLVPSARRRPKSADDLANEVRAAWRKLGRAIKAAKYAGLEVELLYDSKEPKITRRV